ncbi:MAG TPA: DPP IV N-terminal domain-containing protein [candidate division Zixibacteria bacterium]|nr:DPP IV N-terminal domain-containing protein [candidate division Zixibacteria bacterium]
MRRFGVLGLVLALVAGPAAHAQVVVKKGKVRVAVQAFNGPSGAEAASVLRGDLGRSGVIEVVPAEQAEYLVNGTAVVGAISAMVASASDRKEIINQTYSKAWRAATHELADEIVRKLTGQIGIATTRVAFISKRTGHKELYLMDIDGGNVQQLTKDSSISVAPNLAADGSRLAYTSYKGGYPDVYVIELASGKRTRVAAFPGLNSDAAFSSDGRLLALTLSKDGNPEIYHMPAGGGSPTRLTRTRGTEASPCFSPDGRQVAYSSDDRGAPQLYVQPLSGGGAERLNAGVLYATEPSWSPDGKQIAFCARVSGVFQIYGYDVASGKARQLTSGGGNSEDPSWCRDSRHLVIARNGKLALLDAATGESYVLENGFADSSEPSCTR